MSEEREAFEAWYDGLLPTQVSNDLNREDAWFVWQASRRTAHLSNLLALIHRDGGHYEAEHGTEKVVAEAEKRIAERLLTDADIRVAASRKAIEYRDEDKNGMVIGYSWRFTEDDLLELVREMLARAQAKGE